MQRQFDNKKRGNAALFGGVLIFAGLTVIGLMATSRGHVSFAPDSTVAGVDAKSLAAGPLLNDAQLSSVAGRRSPLPSGRADVPGEPGETSIESIDLNNEGQSSGGTAGSAFDLFADSDWIAAFLPDAVAGGILNSGAVTVPNLDRGANVDSGSETFHAALYSHVESADQGTPGGAFNGIEADGSVRGSQIAADFSSPGGALQVPGGAITGAGIGGGLAYSPSPAAANTASANVAALSNPAAAETAPAEHALNDLARSTNAIGTPAGSPASVTGDEQALGAASHDSMTPAVSEKTLADANSANIDLNSLLPAGLSLAVPSPDSIHASAQNAQTVESGGGSGSIVSGGVDPAGDPPATVPEPKPTVLLGLGLFLGMLLLRKRRATRRV